MTWDDDCADGDDDADDDGDGDNIGGSDHNTDGDDDVDADDVVWSLTLGPFDFHLIFDCLSVISFDAHLMFVAFGFELDLTFI